MSKDNSILYGLLAGLGLLIFYLSVLSIFQGIDFAFLNLGSLWYFIFSLAIGFGIQIGLYSSIKHNAIINGVAGGTGGVAGGSMVACCSHFLLNLIPIVGISGLATILMSYQKWFLAVGIIANIFGIIFMLNHRNKMNRNMNGGFCHG